MPIWPYAPGAVTSRTTSSNNSRSGVYTRSCNESATLSILRPRSRSELPRLLDDVLDGAHHVEGLLGQLVVLPLHDLAEAADRLGQRHVDALEPRELLGDVERLREEALDLARPRHGELVVVRQLVHAEDGDD